MQEHALSSRLKHTGNKRAYDIEIMPIGQELKCDEKERVTKRMKLYNPYVKF